MRTKTIKNLGTLVAFAMLSVITPARAASSNYWINNGSGLASAGTNWSSGSPLGAGLGIAYFTNNADYQVTYSGPVYSDGLYYNASSGVVTNNVLTGYLLAYGGYGAFRVGDAAGSTASVVQSGNLYAYDGLWVGNSGQGHFTGTGTNTTILSRDGAYGVGVGYNSGSAGSTFVLTNGASLISNGESWIGQNAGADNNSVLLTGANTVWTNYYHALLGNYGANNQMRIENGAQFVQGGYQLYVGYQASASNNTLLVTGTNSAMTVTDAGGETMFFYVGFVGDHNSVIVSNGGALTFNGKVDARLGVYGNGNNSLIVSGPGSTLTMTNSASNILYVGQEYGNNHVVIENGGRMLMSGGFYVAPANDYGPNSNNTVLVTGTNSFLGISGTTMGIGNAYYSAVGNNSFTISNGAAVKFDGTSVSMGYYYTLNNTFTVTGPGSVFSNTAAEFDVGYYGTGNRLLIDNGGRFVGSNMFVAAGNTLTVTNGGAVVVADKLTLAGTLNLVGGSLQTSNSTGSSVWAVVGGSDKTATWTMQGGNNALDSVTVGMGNNGVLIVTNGAHLKTLDFYAGYNGYTGAVGTNSLTVVTGAGTVWSNAGANAFSIGYNGAAGNTVRIEDGAHVVSLNSAIAHIGDLLASSSNNTLLVTGTNSLFQTGANDFRVGNQGGHNSLIVSNGAKVQLDGGSSYQLVGVYPASDNNLVKVSGTGSRLYWTNTTFGTDFGYQGPSNRLLIENGGQMFSLANGTTVAGHGMTVGRFASSSSNTITVTGANSFWGINANPGSEFTFGFASGGNSMIISNGGHVQYDGRYFEIGNSTANNSITVTGTGSVYSNANADYYVGYGGSNNRLRIDTGAQFYGSNMIVGSGSTGSGIDVRSGGLLDANIYSVYGGNYVTNSGGIYQFSSATPSIVAGTLMVLTNGMISFRGVSNAPVSPLAGVTYQGVNDYQLNGASNAPVASYTFDTGLGASNYRKLQLVGANPTWQGTALTIGTGGALVVSNATGAGVSGTVTDAGTISVIHSTMTWGGNVSISGKYVSDPSTNTFMSNVVVAASGTLAGGAGDLFDFKKSLIINSTNNLGFNLATSAVEFSGGGMHTNAITGADLGANYDALAAAFVTQTNFAYGELHLGSAANQVCFTCGNIPSIASNGLYVGWLDLLGSASLVTNLHAASGINIYYNLNDLRNSYLGQQSYQLTDCNFAPGGGFLMPVVPESSALMLLLMAGGLLARRKCFRSR